MAAKMVSKMAAKTAAKLVTKPVINLLPHPRWPPKVINLLSHFSHLEPSCLIHCQDDKNKTRTASMWGRWRNERSSSR